MMRPSRLLLLAAVCVLASRGTVAAQTVIVRHVPAKTAVQVIVGDAEPVAATQDADGNFRATINALSAGAAEMSAQVFVDACDANVRIVMVGRDANPPAAGAACTRRPITGVYVVRSRTSLVVDLAGQNPSLLTSQGPAPKQWLKDVVVEPQTAGTTPKPRTAVVSYPQTGLMAVGTGDFDHFRKYGDADCGQTSVACSVDRNVLGVTGGLEYWVTPHVGAFGSYSKPRSASTTGSGSGYSFSSQLETDFSTVGGEALWPVGRATVYGAMGATYHRATWTTTNAIADTTVTVGGVPQTLSGGSETFIVKTDGWNLAFGGGVNIWVNGRVGVRAGFDYSFFKGDDLGTSQAKIDDSMLSMKFGVIFRFRKL
ncbi:MAG TPA: hypothetical protein VJN96_18890 [Vicinamibacterales bacterium]|nr:hypothetical protein [Vicinamibacterales bacterium]